MYKDIKLRCAFIDLDFHKTTKSSCFFIDILKKKYSVKTFWIFQNNSKNNLEIEEIKTYNPSIIILYQVELELKFLKEISKNRIVVFVPMFDSIRTKSLGFWYKFYQYKVISFSSHLYKKLHRIGIKSFYIQYFPQLLNKEIINRDIQNGLSVFFWQRRNIINWDQHLKKILEKIKIKKVHIHQTPDPNVKLKQISKKDIKEYNILISRWFKNKDQYLAKVKKADIYFTPRLYEGIGMSFLEAMSLGKCVVAPNNPTMNEYIIDNYNGFLYNPKKVKSFDFTNINKISQNAKTTIINGYKNWGKNQSKIYDFIELESSKKNHQNLKRIIMKILLSIIYFISIIVKRIIYFK